MNLEHKLELLLLIATIALIVCGTAAFVGFVWRLALGCAAG